MLYRREDGTGTEVEPSPSRREVVDRLIAGLSELGRPAAEIADVLNVSVSCVYKRLKVIRARAATIPEAEVTVLDGKPAWVPQDEPRGHRGPCPRCRGVVVPGSPYVCLSCLHSGIDDRLDADLRAERAREAAHRNRRGS